VNKVTLTVIDPEKQTVEVETLPRTFDAIFRRVRQDCLVDHARLAPYGDLCCVDDCGMVDGLPAFCLPGLYGGNLHGTAVLFHETAGGAITAPRLTVSEISDRIQWLGKPII
jgi:hypothetical protein